MRTQGRLDCDTPYADGHVFFSAFDGSFTAGTGTPTRSGAAGSGLYSMALAATDTASLVIPLSGLMFRYGVQDWLQEQFGSQIAGGAQGLAVGGYTALSTAAAGPGSNVSVPVNTSVGFTPGRAIKAGTQNTFIVSIPDATHIVLQTLTATLATNSVLTESLFTTPAGVSGTPPYSGITQLTPVTVPRPKGIAIKAIYPVYSITTAAVTTNTIGITKTVFAPNVAPVVTSVLANAANGLATAANAQPYITPINFAEPASFQVSKYASLNIEWDVTTAAGTANLYGVFLDIKYNWN
jgi:hypothetical protein